MKIKGTPEEFFVEEVISLPLEEKRGRAPFRVYRLEKRGWNTLDALREAARASGLSLQDIRYGGKKDRHAHTIQYLTAPARVDLSFSSPNVSISPVGYSSEAMSPHFIRGNRFTLTLRDIAPADETHLLGRLLEIRDLGFANYFDDQRFGSVGNDGAFFGERVVRGHYNGALKLYFTTIHPETPSAAKERKRAMEALWGQWDALLPLCATPLHREIMEILRRNGGDRGGLFALQRIPREELSLHFAAYQSFLWNEVLRRLVLRHARETFSVKGKTGEYVHFRNPGRQGGARLGALSLPTVASRMEATDPECLELIEEVLAERNVRRAQFNLREIRQSYFSSFLRAAVVVPEEFTWSRPEEDERYPGKRKSTLSFLLPRGSYATMLVKSLGL